MDFEKRIAELEKEVAELKRGLEARPKFDKEDVLGIIQEDVSERLNRLKFVVAGPEDINV